MESKIYEGKRGIVQCCKNIQKQIEPNKTVPINQKHYFFLNR